MMGRRCPHHVRRETKPENCFDDSLLRWMCPRPTVISDSDSMRQSFRAHCRRWRTTLGTFQPSQGISSSWHPNTAVLPRRQSHPPASRLSSCPKTLSSVIHSPHPFTNMKRSYSRRISPVQLLGSRRFFQSDNKQLDPSVHSQHSLQEWTEDKGRLLQKPTFTKEDWFEAISLIEDQEKRFPASEKGRFVEFVNKELLGFYKGLI